MNNQLTLTTIGEHALVPLLLPLFRTTNKIRLELANRIDDASSGAECIRAKIEMAEAMLEHNAGVREVYVRGIEDQTLRDQVLIAVDEHIMTWQTELSNLERYRKFLEEDIQDQMVPDCLTMESAFYAAKINRRIPPEGVDGPNKLFRTSVRERYKASWGNKVWCHLLGWAPKEDVRVYRLVPKRLQSTELAYLFGVEDIHPRHDPTNGIYRTTLALELGTEWLTRILGITLYRAFARALDRGYIVICPVDRQEQGWPVEYKTVLVNKQIADQIAYDSSKWRVRTSKT